MKTCAKCLETKDLTEFYVDKIRKSGLRNRCKTCWGKDTRKYLKKKYRKSPSTIFKYGVTVEAYTELLERQNGRCAICGSFPITRLLGVDHNHETGKVRGLLCHECNVAIGFLQEDPDILNSAINYLRRHAE